MYIFNNKFQCWGGSIFSYKLVEVREMAASFETKPMTHAACSQFLWAQSREAPQKHSTGGLWHLRPTNNPVVMHIGVS